MYDFGMHNFPSSSSVLISMMYIFSRHLNALITATANNDTITLWFSAFRTNL